MAIYIKGMEMPKHRAIDLTITPDGSVIIWGTTHKLLDEKCTYIPEPHGRLIDADKAIEDYANYGISHCYDAVDLKDIMDDSPTVIEGSE